MTRLVAMTLMLAMVPVPVGSSACFSLTTPVDGPVVAGFAPVGRYAGHWGVDLSAAPGSPVVAPGAGRITWVGTIDENTGVTIDLGGGVVASVSYVERVLVRRNQVVREGQVVATSGAAHGLEAAHFSLRIDGRYVNPERVIGCRPVELSGALRLTG